MALEHRLVPMDKLKINSETQIFVFDDKANQWFSLTRDDKKNIFFASVKSDIGVETSRVTACGEECGICLHRTIDRARGDILHISNKKCRYLEKICTKCIFTWIFHCESPVCPFCKTEIGYGSKLLEQK